MIILELLLSTFTVLCSDAKQFDVLKISDVPFPSIPWGEGDGKSTGIATINATYKTSISDYTVCYRFLLESYNDVLYVTIGGITS